MSLVMRPAPTTHMGTYMHSDMCTPKELQQLNERYTDEFVHYLGKSILFCTFVGEQHTILCTKCSQGSLHMCKIIDLLVSHMWH